MRRFTVALATTALLTLSACGGGDDEPSSSSSPAASSEATTEASEAPAEQTRLDVDETIKDDKLGHTIKITGLVRDFDAPSRTTIPEGGGEWVLVEVDVKAGDKYSGGVRGGFSLYTTDGSLAGSSTTILKDDMVAADLRPWEGTSSGEQSKGWIAFQVNTRADAYQLQYKRLAANIIGGGSIPEKIWKIDLPTS